MDETALTFVLLALAGGAPLLIEFLARFRTRDADLPPAPSEAKIPPLAP